MHCKFKCGEKFPHEKRLEINKQYYELVGDRNQNFICRLVETGNIERKRQGTGKRPKNISCAYYLPVTSGEEKNRVCQKIFSATLAISKKTVHYAVTHMNDIGEFVNVNAKKGRPAVNKTSEVRFQKHLKTY